MKRLTFLVLLATPLPASASPATEVEEAVSARYSVEWRRCTDGAVGDALMMGCISAEGPLQDAALNRVYRALLARLSRAHAARLRASQRAWLRNREGYCERGIGLPLRQWRTLERLRFSGCHLDSTVRRTIWLERYRDGRATLRDLNR